MAARKNNQRLPDASQSYSLLLGGDVMTGRGIDQLFREHSDPGLYESYVKDARRYLRLGMEESGSIALPVDAGYIWGEAKRYFAEAAFRLVNLETSITTSDQYWKGKGIHYRMHPANVHTLTAVEIDFCALANNHVLDWGRQGLLDTMIHLEEAGIKFSGAGKDASAAAAPAVFPLAPDKRLLVFSAGLPSSGIPSEWAAGEDRSGVFWLPGLTSDAFLRIAEAVEAWREPGDIVVCSIHWGGNWGYGVPEAHRRFAHRLIAEAGIDLIHGHSSHHLKGIEVFEERLILYGCGDLINDYEGIGGREKYPEGLPLFYFPTLSASGTLEQLRMVPLQIRRFQLQKAPGIAAGRIHEILNREGKNFGTGVKWGREGDLLLTW